jgi:hypothetical protein
MELKVGNNSEQQEPSNQAGRPPPIILPSASNLLQLHRSNSEALPKAALSFKTQRLKPEL